MACRGEHQQAIADIQGPQFWSQPWFATRFKLRYDEQFLYIAAYLEETAVWGNVSERNDVIFHDNDFEVFVDADGSTHNYKEFELNARNATWNLWLNRPYRDGGHENSSRVDPLHGFDMLSSGMRSAVFVPGHINDPGERLHYWTAEIALPLSQLALHSKAQVPPTPLTFWRINFSRVEWPVRLVTNSQTGKQHYEKEPGIREENWVWSAQYAVDMHRPEWWGYLQFRPRSELPSSSLDNRQPSEVAVPLDPEWSVRYVSFQFYYAQHAFHKATRSFTSHMEELLPFVTSREALGCMTVLDIHASTESFTARIASKYPDSNKDLQFIATIKDDGYIVVDKMSSTDMAATYE
ncbi:hypothetical protein BBJ28_00019238 [Nothophytophthora sp. Chile5]|nr:hypothetical protein BBJ28_00019238 [Nothophytophthora sp. Chile5]